MAVAAGLRHSIGLKSDGTVVAVGDNSKGQCDVGAWNMPRVEIADSKAELEKSEGYIAIASTSTNIFGIRKDGTVAAVGNNAHGQCDVTDWTDIVTISAQDYVPFTIGLRSDGTCVAAGDNRYGSCDVSDWTDIIAISSGESGHTVGLRSDGTVVAAGRNDEGQCNVSNWSDIVIISANGTYTLGVKSDGTCVFTGKSDDNAGDVSKWTSIVDIVAGPFHSLGLRKDGTVVFTGDKYWGQDKVNGWTDIESVTAGLFCSIGIRKNGAIVVSSSEDLPKRTTNWSDIVDIQANYDYEYIVGLKGDGTVVIASEDNKWHELGRELNQLA